ncbi:MAG: lysostaphin resistance A-like protein [Haloferacaceae archaeon]
MSPRSDASSEPIDGIVVAGRTVRGPAAVVAVAVVVALVGLGISQAIPIAVLSGLSRVTDLSLVPAVTLQVVLTELVGFGFATWASLRLRGLSVGYVHVRVPTVRDLGWMVGGTVVVLVLYFAYVTGIVLTGVPLARSGISVAGQAEPTLLLVLAGLSFVLVGPMEELFFRGIVQETMREVLPGNQAVALASLTFASIHYITMVGPVVGKVVLLGSLFITSLVLGVAYERTRNLAVNAVVHGAYNAALLVLAYVVFSQGLV